MTTKFIAGFVEKVSYTMGGKLKFRQKPMHIDEYNKLMGGVDATDQALEPYDPCQKTLAWFKKLGIPLITRMTLNSFVLHRKANELEGPIRHRYLGYLQECCDQVLMKYSIGYAAMAAVNNQRALPAPVVDAIHCLLPIPPTTKKKRPQKKCRECLKAGVRKDSRKQCPACPTSPAFCSNEHFSTWHDGTEK